MYCLLLSLLLLILLPITGKTMSATRAVCAAVFLLHCFLCVDASLWCATQSTTLLVPS